MWVGILHSGEVKERKPKVSLREKEFRQGYPAEGSSTIMPADYQTACLSPPGQVSLIKGLFPGGVQPVSWSQVSPTPQHSCGEQRVVLPGVPGQWRLTELMSRQDERMPRRQSERGI